MLTLVGVGLCDGLDLTLRGKQAVDRASAVYLETYTSVLQCTHQELEQQLGKKIHLLNRADVELHIQKIIDEAREQEVVVLIIGDVFGATTHTDLYLRAKEHVAVAVIHNASIINAIGATGLELYRFGKTVSIPYWLPGFEPTSFVAGIQENLARGLHTLCLLDIKADEQRFMTVAEGIAHLQKAGALLADDAMLIGVARIGCPTQRIVAGSIARLMQEDFGPPPHALVVAGKLHHVEEEMLRLWQ